MSLLVAVTPALPLGKSGKFVAGAYIVFLVLVLVYVGIMAVRAQRIERELSELERDVEAARAAQAQESQPEPVLAGGLTPPTGADAGRGPA